ncbi:MAG: hypothetical protein ABI886_02075 [Betaproteobacteria bacterium]
MNARCNAIKAERQKLELCHAKRGLKPLFGKAGIYPATFQRRPFAQYWCYFSNHRTNIEHNWDLGAIFDAAPRHPIQNSMIVAARSSATVVRKAINSMFLFEYCPLSMTHRIGARADGR